MLGENQYLLEGARDGVTAIVFLLASQVLALKMAPSAALPALILYHGAVAFFPLTMILRMLLRPQPDPETPIDTNGMTPEQVFWAAWKLNALLMTAMWFLCAMNVSDKPSNVSPSSTSQQ
jgi:hypothetical protein